MSNISRSTGRPDSDAPTPRDRASSIDEGGSTLAIACALDTLDLQARLAEIRDLAFSSLRQSRREGGLLRLIYDRKALTEVENLVARESECCAFLDFDVTYDDAGVQVTITAPAEVVDTAEELFAHFTSEPVGSQYG